MSDLNGSVFLVLNDDIIKVIKNDQEMIEDVAVIKPVSDERATKELLNSKGDELVYHTANENIVLEIRPDVGLRRFEYLENQA